MAGSHGRRSFYAGLLGCVLALALGSGPVAHAQQLRAASSSATSSSAASSGNVPESAAGDEFVPKGLSLLKQNASWHTDFTFDRSMLALTGKLEGLDETTRQAEARLNSVTVHSYRYAAPGVYDIKEVDSIRAQYDALGWKHVVSKRGKTGPDKIGSDQVAVPGRTDLWVHLNGVNIAGVAVLLAEPSSLNLVSVSGDISTLDLLKLRGHFGIPKFDPDSIGPLDK